MACTHLFPLLIRVRAFAWSLQPHLSCRFYHYSLGTDGVFCQLLSNLIFFFLLHWSIPSTFPLSTLLLEEDIYSFQHASSCQHYCDLTLQCSYFHCKNNSNAATNNYHFIYRLSSVNNQDTNQRMKYQQISTILMLKIENVLHLSSKSFYQDIPDKHVLCLYLLKINRKI